MQMVDTCVFIAEEFAPNEINEIIPTETRREVLCTLGSITRSEFFEAGRSGLNPELMITVFWLDYNGEKTVEFHGQRYGVYRSYTADEESVELYLEKKAGA